MLGSLSSKEIEDLLEAEVVARLGCHADGRTYVVPVSYTYDAYRRRDASAPRKRPRVDLPHRSLRKDWTIRASLSRSRTMAVAHPATSAVIDEQVLDTSLIGQRIQRWIRAPPNR